MIRRAKDRDVPGLTGIAARFFEAGQYWGGRRGFDPDFFAAYLASLTGRADTGFFVADKDGSAVGFIAGLLTPNPYTGAPACLKTQWCVDPIAGRGRGLALLRHLERWARARGASEIFAASMSDQGAAILQKTGYAPFEVNFSKVLS